MKIYMRPELGSILKIMTQVNALGETKFYMIDKNWSKYEYEAQQYRETLKMRKQERFMRMMAEAIADNARNKDGPKPSKDLFV
jgi:hypothetical protein